MALALKDEKLNAITKNNGVLHAGVSSFGFGGTNAHVILSVFEQDVLESSELVMFTPSVLRPIQHTWNIQVMPNKDTVNANRPTTPLGGTEPTLALYNQNDHDIASTDLAWDAEFDTFLLMNWFRSSQYSFSPPANFCSLSTYKSDDMSAKTHVMVNATGQNIWLAIEATQKLCTITHLHVVYVIDEEACLAGFLGFTRSLRLEYGSWQVQCVILTEGKSKFPTNMDLFQLAIPKNVDDIWVTPNSNGRYKLFERKLVEIEHLQTTNSPLDRVASSGILNLDGVYLVTGGLSGIGKVLGDWLLQNGARKVIRISRRGEIVVGSDLMDETPPSWWNETSVSLSCDVTMKSSFATLLRSIEMMCKFDDVCIRGVIHCAGVMERCTFSNLTTQQLSQHYQVKVGSARTLHEFFRDPIRSASLEFFVLCSSLSSLVGYHSGSAYSVSNAALDELSKEGVSLGLPSISIQWGRWTQVGMAASQRSTQGSKYGITNQAGCCALERIVNMFHVARTEGVAIDPCIAVADRDWRGALGNMKRTPSILRNVLPDDANVERVSEHHVVHTDASRMTEPNIELISNIQMPGSTAALNSNNSKQEPQQHFGRTAHVTDKEHRDRLEQLENERVWFGTIVSLLTELGIPAAQLAQFNMSTSWMEVGLDSLALVDLRNSIEDNMKNFTMNNEAFLSDTLLLDHATPRALHDFLQPRNSIVSIPNENHTFKFDLATGLSDRSLDFQPMAITGMSLRLPGAGCDSPFGFWDFLLRGGDGIVEIPQERFDVDAVYDPKLGSINKMYVKRAGLLDDIINFDNELFNITAVEASEMDPHQRIALEVAYEALTNANIIGPNAPSGPSRTGVFVAAQNTEFSAMQSLEGSQRANRSVGPFSATGQSLSIIANRISYTLDLVGPSVSIDTACSSSLVALDVAAKAVRDGDCDNAIVLAVELHLSPSRYISTCAARMLSPRGVCATFSDTADGYVRGEGCAAIVIEPLSIAASNNTPVWSVVRSVAINQDGKSANLTSPNGPAQELVIRRSLQRADLQPDQLDMVEAHGTGTALGDPQEIQALGQVFSGRNRPLVIGAAKSNVGHLEAAAGIVGIIKASLCTLFRMSPPNLHCDTLNPRIVKLPALKASQLVFPVSSTPLGVVDQPVYVGVSSFGFGGTNAHAILQSYDPECIPSHTKVQFRRVPFPIREYCHPFVGSPLAPVRTTEEVCFSWECKWSEQILKYLSQHRVGRVPLVPGTCYIEMVGAAVRQHFGTNQAYTLSNIQFESILYLNSTTKRSRQVFTEFFRRKSFMKDDTIEVRILSKDPTVDEDDNRTLHATLQLHLGETWSSKDPNNEPIDVAKVKQRCGDFMECGENFYSQLGNQYIGEFTCLKRVWKSNHETLGEIVFEEENVPSYLRHCALLDVASHAIMAGLPVAERSKPLYAAAAGEYQVPTKRTAIVRTAWSHVTVDESGCINCSIYDADTKELVARMCGQKVGTFKKLPEARWKPDKNMSVYNETWQSFNASVAHEPKDSFNYLEAVELSVIQFHTKVLNLLSFKPTKDTIVLVPTTNVSGVQGYLRSVIAERPELRFRMVHIDLHGVDDSNEIVRHLPESIPSSKGEELLYLASTSTWKCRRLIPSTQHYNLQVSSIPEWCTLLKSGPLKGDCVITGGLGSVGKQLTDIILLEDLLDQNARLILLTRRSESQLDDDKFSTLLTHGLDARKVEIVRCDVGDEESMPQLFSMFPNISAIFHCAGVLRDGALEEITETSFRDVFTPKVGCLLGVLASMDQGLGRKLKLVVSFSSISASQGSPGQANYAAANAALDGITEKLNLEHTYPQVRFLSLNFGPLLPDGVIQEGTGMVTEEVLNSIYRRSGVKVTDTKYALKYMLSVLPLGADQESQQDDDRQLDSLQVKLQETSSQFKMRETTRGQEGVHSSFNVCTLDTYRLPAGNKLYDLIRTTSSHTEVQEEFVNKFKRLVENGVDNTGEWIEVALQSLFNIMDQLGFPQPDDQRTTWREAGLDSLTMVEFRNTLAEKYENVLALSDAVLFNFPTPLLLATMIVEKLKAHFRQCDMPKAPAHVLNAPTNDIRVSNDPKNHVQPHNTLGNPEPMAVIASSCVFPGGVTTPQQLVELLGKGKRVMTEIPTERFDWVKHFDPEPGSEFKTYVKHGAFIRDVDAFDSERFPFTDVEVSAMDPQQRLAIETCARAWDFLATNGSKVSTNCGVFAGVMTNDWLMCHARKSNTPANPYTATGYSGAIIANRISYALGLTGPSMVIDTACSSSLVAVDTACNAIRRGQCDCAIVTGVNLLLSEDNFVAESAARMLSPKGRCETFGETADGYARGEGCGAVILKPLSAALRDGDPILATIAGSAVNQDGRSANLVSPNGLAQVQVIKRAIAEAGIQPQDIGMIEAHGTGTPLGDPLEVEALVTVFGDESPSRAHPLIVGALKSCIGHLEGASGIAGLIKAIECVRRGTCPQNIRESNLNPRLNALLTRCRMVFPTEEISISSSSQDGSKYIGVSGFGFGGTNAHVIVKSPPTSVHQTDDSCVALNSSRRKFQWMQLGHPMFDIQGRSYSGTSRLANLHPCIAGIFPTSLLFDGLLHAAKLSAGYVGKLENVKFDLLPGLSHESMLELNTSQSDCIEITMNQGGKSSVVSHALIVQSHTEFADGHLENYTLTFPTSLFKLLEQEGKDIAVVRSTKTSIMEEFSPYDSCSSTDDDEEIDSSHFYDVLGYRSMNQISPKLGEDVVSGFAFQPQVFEWMIEIVKEAFKDQASKVDLLLMTPLKIGKLTAHDLEHLNTLPLFCHVSNARTAKSSFDGFKADVALYDKDRQVVLSLQDIYLTLTPVGSPLFETSFVSVSNIENQVETQNLAFEQSKVAVWPASSALGSQLRFHAEQLDSIAEVSENTNLLVLDFSTLPGDFHCETNQHPPQFVCDWENTLKAAVETLQTTLQVLDSSKSFSAHVCVVTERAYRVRGDEYCRPDMAAIWGIVKSISQEVADIHFSIIDVPTTSRTMDARLQQLVWKGIAAQYLKKESMISMLLFRQQGGYFKPHLRPSRLQFKLAHVLSQGNSSGSVPTMSSHGTYIVTGGVGGLGLLTAAWLLEHGAKYILLLSRSGKPREGIATQDSERIFLEKVKTWPEAKVETVACDVSDFRDIKLLFETYMSNNSNKTQFPKCTGIFHSAGVMSDGMLMNQTWDSFKRVLHPKLGGAINLHLATEELGYELEHFVVYSSLAGLFGAPGQSNHSAGNAALDSFVQWRKAQGKPATAIQWGGWSDIGHAANHSSGDMITSRGLGMISNEMGKASLNAICNKSRIVAVNPINWPVFLSAYQDHSLLGFFAKAFQNSIASREFKPAQSSTETPKEKQSSNEYENNKVAIRDWLTAFVRSRHMKVPEGTNSWTGVGLDSLGSIEMGNGIRKEFGVRLQPNFHHTYQTLSSLQEKLVSELSTSVDSVDRNSTAGGKVLPPSSSSSKNSKLSRGSNQLDGGIVGNSSEHTNYSPWSDRVLMKPLYRVFCFAYAGGDPSVYACWMPCFPSTYQICPVPLPGFGRPQQCDSIQTLAASIADTLPTDTKYILAGQCLGAIVAYEVCRQISQRALPLPESMYVMAASAPNLYAQAIEQVFSGDLLHDSTFFVKDDRLPETSSLSGVSFRDLEFSALNEDEQLEMLQRLRNIGFFQDDRLVDALRQDKSTLDSVMDQLACQMRLAQRYTYVEKGPPLPIPLTTFFGGKDTTIPDGYPAEWSKFTSEQFELIEFSNGGHYLLEEFANDITKLIQKK